MKIVLPLGRLNKEAKKMFCEFFKLSYSFFNDKKEREFYFKKDGYEVYFLKPKDITRFSELYEIEYFITSNDQFFNNKSSMFDIVEDKILGIQRLSLIGLNKDISKITTIVSPYSNIAKEYFPDKKIVHFESSLEIFPILNSDTGIIDIVETGSTMQIHNLIELKEILKTKILILKKKGEI